MATLLNLLSIFSGGPGSGCHGPNCGRPLSPKERMEQIEKEFKGVKRQQHNWDRNNWVKDQMQKHGQGNSRRARAWWRKEYERQLALKPQAVQPKKPDLSKKQEKWLKKNAAPIGKAVPGIRRYKGVESIKVAPVSQRKIKQQFIANNGAQVTIVKPPGQKEKTGATWLIRPSPYKGQFVQNLDTKADLLANTKVAFFIARDPNKERAVAVQVWRNFGEKATSVTEMDLLQYDAIARSRQATFNNMGRASGFLAKRYGISFKFK